MNRRLANEMARADAGWDVTAVAPRRYQGDLRFIELETDGTDVASLVPVTAHLTRYNHAFVYGAAVARLLRKEPWDLIHLWEEPFVFSAAEVARLAPRDTPLVFTTYQNLDKRYPPPFSAIERYVVRRARGWIAGGELIASTLLARPGYAARPHVVLPMGVDPEAFRPDPARRAATRASLGWSDEGPPVVGYTGRFVAEKGVGVLAEALDRVRSPWRALFIGKGPLERELGAFAARHADRVRIVPAVKHDEVPAFIAAMDVLAAPSLTTPAWREQFGRMIVEAFATGIPVVGSDSGEVPFTVGDGGVIVAEGDIDAWSRELDRLLTSPDLRAALGAKALSRARSTFAWSVVARKTLQFFDEVLAEPHAKRATAPVVG